MGPRGGMIIRTQPLRPSSRAFNPFVACLECHGVGTKPTARLTRDMLKCVDCDGTGTPPIPPVEVGL